MGGEDRPRCAKHGMAIIANNLANTNTTGFKAGPGRVPGPHYQNIRPVGLAEHAEHAVPDRLYLGTGVRIVATEKDYTQGSVNQTNASLDMSVNGRGFFRSPCPTAPLPIRATALLLGQSGNVVTAAGYPLQPAIIFLPAPRP